MGRNFVMSFLAAFLAVRFSLSLEAIEPAPPRRPNIVIIMADDMGFSDLGSYGSEIATPALDRLAARGLRFTQFYNTGRCCPTRAALLTGLYPHQAGVGHMVEDRGRPAYQGYLNDRCVTIAEALRPGGYHTLMAGKWHVGEKRPHWPVDRGFERYFGIISGGTNYFRLDAGRQMAVDDKPYTPDEGRFYITDALSDRAAAFVEEYGRKAEPFFLYVAYTAPHWPLHALPEDIAKYRGKYLKGWDALREERHRRMIEMGLVEARWELTPRDEAAPPWSEVKEKEAWDLKMAVYAAQIDRMDQGIGRILARLKEVGAEENTLVLFLADNGGCAEEVDRGRPGAPPGDKESFLSYGLPWANASNTPFRLYKHWVHEGGIATPLIASWPGVIQGGGITHQPGHLIDLMATCLEVAGVEYPKMNAGRETVPIEGKSLLPIFRGATRQGHDALFWEHEGNRAVRQGKWKLAARHRGPWELYDLETDRTERHDLAAMNPEKVKELAGMYERWAERAGVAPWDEIRGKKAARASGASLREEARNALRRAVEFFRTQVAAEGGYLWRYSGDLKRREGEGKASASTVWVQPPGTPSVGMAYLEAHEASGDDDYLDAAREAAMALVKGQLRSGGWDYRIEFDPGERRRYAYRAGAASEDGRNVTTLDDNTTQSALRFLMRMDKALAFKDATIHEAAGYALSSLLKAQYPNGAWPQRYDRFPEPEQYPVKKAGYPPAWPRDYPGGDYRGHYTFNDNAIADMIETLFEAARIYGEARYKAAAEKAGGFILLAQMPEPQPAWAQQYDAGMHPTWARKFEPPAVSGGESQGILRVLLELYRETGEEKYLEPVPRALDYLRRSRLGGDSKDGGRLARFYELETNKPLYFTKDYKLTQSDADMPTHYAFKVGDDTEGIAREYERLRAQGPEASRKPKEPSRPRPSERLAAQARAAIDSLDDRGRWLEEGQLKYQGAGEPAGKIIDSRTFIRNARVLSAYLAATSP